MKSDTKKSCDVREISSIKDMLKQSIELYGDRPAFLAKHEKGGDYFSIEYKQLGRDVNAIGTALLEMGLKDKKVAIIGENCYQWIVTYLAVVNGLGIVVPLDKELLKEEIHNLIEISKCDAVFYTDTYAEIFKDYPVKHKVEMKVYLDGTGPWEDLKESGAKSLEAGNIAYTELEPDVEAMNMLLFSSGTTGTAKGIMLNHRNIVNNVMDTARVVEVYETDRTLSLLPIHHTFENTLGMMFVLYRGASAAFCEGLKYVAKNFAEAQATILVGVPLIFESIYSKIWKQAEKSGKAGALKKAIKASNALGKVGIHLEKKLFKTIYDSFGGKLRLIVCGAAAVDPNVVRGYEDLGIVFLQGFGLTECSPLVTGTPELSNRRGRENSVGPVVYSGELKVENPDEEGVGEILYKGPNVMLGYYEMPEATAEVLKDGWFYTGDLGYLDKDNWLYLTGRKKNVIVTKTGKNIYPEEIEMYANRAKYIHESLVHGVDEDEEAGTVVGIQVHPDYDLIYEEFGQDLDEASIYKLIKDSIKEINEKLPIYKRIRNISIRKDEFIKTTTKKIKRFKHIGD